MGSVPEVLKKLTPPSNPESALGGAMASAVLPTSDLRSASGILEGSAGQTLTTEQPCCSSFNFRSLANLLQTVLAHDLAIPKNGLQKISRNRTARPICYG